MVTAWNFDITVQIIK